MECVIDSELLLKISSEPSCCDISDLIDTKFKSGETLCGKDLEECVCIKNLLKEIKKKKCKIGLSDDIRLDYSKIINNIPTDLKILFHAIISRKDYHIDVDELNLKKLSRAEKAFFNNTLIVSKIHYIDGAHCLDNKTIISERNEVELKYNKHSDKLILVGVECKDVCSFYDEIG